MGTYDTIGGEAISPRNEEPGSAEIELTRAEWQIVVGALILHAEWCNSHRGGTDWKETVELAKRLEQYKRAKGAMIEVWE
jgi:hypothetical protein